MSDIFHGWHFSDESECLRYGDGRKIEVGITHTVDCEPVLCEVGLHASEHVLDALTYSPGLILWHVTLSGKIIYGEDKACATARTYNTRLDATELLRSFARKCALDVIHLWNAPDVVRQYLETGNEELRTAAYDAAIDAARSAAYSAAYSAASDAAYDAARSATKAATSDSACAAAYAAAYAAAKDAAYAVAYAIAYAAARDAQKKTLEMMVRAAGGKG